MENKIDEKKIKKEDIEKLCELFEKDKVSYNEFMHQCFGTLDKVLSSLYNNHQLFSTKETSIKKMKNNISYLWNYINSITKEKNKEFYQCLSCIYGSFMGDAIGVYCEFLKPSKRNQDYIFKGNPQFGDCVGQVTDDSEMAMALAYALMDNPDYDKINETYLMYYFGAWYLSGPNDIGNATKQALKGFRFEDYIEMDPSKNINFKSTIENISKANQQSLANGFLMRISPFIVWTYIHYKDKIDEAFNKNIPDPEKQSKLVELYNLIKDEARKNNKITHPNPETISAAGIFIIMGFGAIYGLTSKEIIDIIKILIDSFYFKNEKEEIEIRKFILDDLDKYSNNKEKPNYFNYFDVYPQMGYYRHAFRLTIYYLYYFNEYEKDKPIDKIGEEICNLGGDADTNAAIVLAVIGPLVGLQKFGKKFYTVFNVLSIDRYMFSPCLMVLFVYHLLESLNVGKVIHKNLFAKTIMTFLLLKFELKKCDKINSKSDGITQDAKDLFVAPDTKNEDLKTKIIPKKQKNQNFIANLFWSNNPGKTNVIGKKKMQIKP